MWDDVSGENSWYTCDGYVTFIGRRNLASIGHVDDDWSFCCSFAGDIVYIHDEDGCRACVCNGMAGINDAICLVLCC